MRNSGPFMFLMVWHIFSFDVNYISCLSVSIRLDVFTFLLYVAWFTYNIDLFDVYFYEFDTSGYKTVTATRIEM